MNVPTKPGQEEYVRDMAPRESLAAIQDVPTKLSKKGFVSSMVPRSALRFAVMQDVPTKLSRRSLCKARCKEEKIYLQP